MLNWTGIVSGNDSSTAKRAIELLSLWVIATNLWLNVDWVSDWVSFEFEIITQYAEDFSSLQLIFFHIFVPTLHFATLYVLQPHLSFTTSLYILQHFTFCNFTLCHSTLRFGALYVLWSNNPFCQGWLFVIFWDGIQQNILSQKIVLYLKNLTIRVLQNEIDQFQLHLYFTHRVHI